MTSARTPESRRRRQGTSGSAATNEASGTTTRMCQSLFSCFALENPRLLAGIGEKSLLARAMHAAHRRLETYAPGAVQLAKLAVLIRLQPVAASRNTFLVLGPQQLQRRRALVKFLVHMRVVNCCTPRGLVAARVAKQQRFRLTVGHALHAFPRHTRRLGSLQVAADRADCRRQRARYFTLATAARFVQSQNFSNLSHAEALRHPVAVAPLRGALDDSRSAITPSL